MNDAGQATANADLRWVRTSPLGEKKYMGLRAVSQTERVTDRLGSTEDGSNFVGLVAGGAW
ncbi:hypothetical protein WDW86_11595 [Bdellovibrionota bacterium FG-2]